MTIIDVEKLRTAIHFLKVYTPTVERGGIASMEFGTENGEYLDKAEILDSIDRIIAEAKINHLNSFA